MAYGTTGWKTPSRLRSATRATRQASPICGPPSALLRVEDERRNDAGGRRESRVTGGKPTGTALHLAQVGVRLHIHLHLTEFHLAKTHQREDRAYRVHALLYHVGRSHGLLKCPLPLG